MDGRWSSRADESDYIADTLHRIEDDIKAEVDQGVAPEAERRRADQISVNAEPYRAKARTLRRAAAGEGQGVDGPLG